MAIELPRCFYCNRIAPELVFEDALGDDQAICVHCMDEYSGYTWAVYDKGEADYAIAAATNRQFNTVYPVVFSGTYAACWAWGVEHSPQVD